MSARYDLDRSTMHANLSTLSAKFGALDQRSGSALITEVLAAWYDTTEDDMFAFTKEWIKRHRKDLLPLKAK